MTYREQVAAALAELEIESPTTYRWLGSTRRVETTLVDDVADSLYADFYCRGTPTATPVPARRPAAARAGFLEALSDANAGSGAWTLGWTVAAVDGDDVTFHDGAFRVRAATGGYAILDGGAARVGAAAAVELPKEQLGLSPGYYVALGDAPFDARSACARVYFDTTAEAAAPLVAALTRELNARSVPFRLKTLDDPLAYARCDACVLYLSRDAFVRIERLLPKLVSKLVGDGAPALTLPLARGVAYAEAPPGESFGAHRSRLIATAAVAAAGLETAARVERVAGVFAAAGLTLATPYLSAAPVDFRLRGRETRRNG